MTEATNLARAGARAGTTWGVVVIILGILSIAMPLLTGLALTLTLGARKKDGRRPASSRLPSQEPAIWCHQPWGRGAFAASDVPVTAILATGRGRRALREVQRCRA